METSIFLAKVIGIVAVISTTAIITNYKKNMALEKEAVSHAGLAAITGYAILILGALLVVSHSVWTADWRIVITIISYLTLLKGVGRIFFPEAVKNMIERKQTNTKFIFGEIAVFLIGLYLLYYGFIAY